jgi:ferredoxin
MKVRVDLEVCQGHARCQEICPQVFATDDLEGKCVILSEEVPPEHAQDAMLAVRNCPEGALSCSDD